MRKKRIVKKSTVMKRKRRVLHDELGLRRIGEIMKMVYNRNA
jgi:hypothetical protein